MCDGTRETKHLEVCIIKHPSSLQMMQERELLSRDREELVRQLDRARQEYQLQHEQLIERER